VANILLMNKSMTTKGKVVGESRLAGRPCPLLSAVFLMVWLFSFTAVFASETARASDQKPVVMVILDEFSTAFLLDQSGERIHKGRFPNFHALSKDAAWYRRHTTVADFTVRAVPAILTGNSGGYTYADYRQHPDSLYTFLANESYSFIKNLEIYSQICPPGICAPPSGTMFLDPQEGESPFGFSSRILKSTNQTKRQKQWLRRLGSLKSDEAAVAHILLPHGPYRFLPNGNTYKDILKHSFRKDGRVYAGDRGLFDLARKRIMFQIGYVDLLLGKIMNSIKKSDRWKETLLVVTGDHGVSLKPGHPARRVVPENRHEIGLTPLFVKYPNQSVKGRKDTMSQSVDIVPTIAQSIGLDLPYKTDGVPLSDVRENREVSIGNLSEESFPVTAKSADRWLRRMGRSQAKRLGNRGLAALGVKAGKIGKRAPKARLRGNRALKIAGLANLRKPPAGTRRPALIQGQVKKLPGGSGLTRGTGLLLALDGRFVASASIYRYAGRKSFSFLVHPRFLSRRGLPRLQIFRISRAGQKVRVF